MKCPKCQFENPEEMQFCVKCGNKLEINCPECGSRISSTFKFCGKCGHGLSQPAEAPPIDYSEPQSYTPKFLVDKILTTRSSIEGERKLVTVLFADVANYTAIAEKLDPEDIHQILDWYFKILMDEIHKYEGTINQFTGDDPGGSIQELLGPETSNLFEIESHTRINLGENYLMKGNLKKALEHLDLVYANSLKPEYFFNPWRYKPRCLLGLGELWLQKGDLSKAQFYKDEVTDHGWTTKFPYKKYQVRSGRLQGNIYAAQGRFDEAEIELQHTLKRAEQLGNPTQIWKTLQALDKLFHDQEKIDRSVEQYRSALKIVEKMAEDLTYPELKERFLQSDTIHEVIVQAEQN